MPSNDGKGMGRFYVVGVGPGDPELLTVKAARVLSRVPVIFMPQKDEESPGYARRTIAGLVREPEQKVIGLVFPMRRDRQLLAEHWQRAAESVWSHLREGDDCAFISLGDPLLYGTSIHITDALRRDYPEVDIEVIPGVSSISAAAARAVVPLGVGDERVAIISGHCEDRIVTETLENFDTVVFLKVHTAFDRLLGILEGMKLLDRCVYVSRCTTEDERIVRDISQLKGKTLDYLSLLIVRR